METIAPQSPNDSDDYTKKARADVASMRSERKWSRYWARECGTGTTRFGNHCFTSAEIYQQARAGASVDRVGSRDHGRRS